MPLLTPILYGREITLFLPNGERHSAQFAICELSDIIASHNEKTFASSEGYPVNDSGYNVNDRNYSGDTGAQAIVQQYAQDLRAEFLITNGKTPSGTPIVNNDGFVISGNNRTMSLKLAATDFKDKYKEYCEMLFSEITYYLELTATPEGVKQPNGAIFTLLEMQTLADGSVVFEYEYKGETTEKRLFQPVLVRIDKDIKTLSTSEMAKFNQTEIKGKRPVDKAIELSNIIREKPERFAHLPLLLDKYDTMTDFYASRTDQKAMLEGFLNGNLITQQEISTYYDATMGFTSEGKDFVEMVLVATALNRQALLASDTAKNLRAIIVQTIPALMDNIALGEASLSRYINDVFLLEVELRTRAMSVQDFRNQTTMFSEKQYDNRVFQLHRLMHQGKNAFKKAIVGYNSSLKSTGSATMFGDAYKVTPNEAFATFIVCPFILNSLKKL
jgi:ddrB-like ParB superfamily domain